MFSSNKKRSRAICLAVTLLTSFQFRNNYRSSKLVVVVCAGEKIEAGKPTVQLEQDLGATMQSERDVDCAIRDLT